MAIENEVKKILKAEGVDFIKFVDISKLPEKQNKSFPNAILFGIVLSSDYLQKIACTTEYVKQLKENDQISTDEFHLTEQKTDQLADKIASHLTAKGYDAYSQSEDNIYKTGFYKGNSKTTPLPHKTIASMAGLGWIGKHNLLVNPKFGSAISMCTVLTNAPLNTACYPPTKPLCGDCVTCKNVCSAGALHGNAWDDNTHRDDLIDVHECTTCIECMVFCPWTQKYIKNP